MFPPHTDDELNHVTDRLNAYIKRMRDMRTGAAHLDVHTFFKSVDAMEREMVNLKSMYEKECQKLKRQLDDSNRKKNHYQRQSDQLEAAAADLQNRTLAEVDKSHRVLSDYNILKQTLHQKELELKEIRQRTSAGQVEPDSAVALQLDQTIRENLDLKQKYEAAFLQNKEFEEQIHQLTEQLEFTGQVAEQQQATLQERLAAATSAVLHLEDKLKLLIKPEHEEQVADMIASVREAADKNLYKYKQEAQDEFGRNISMLRAQMDADRKSFEVVTAENRRLLGTVEELNAKIRNLQGEMLHLEHNKKAADENLIMEKDRANRHVQALETKLRDLQEMLFDKMTELNTVRTLNAPLKTEFDSMRALNAEKERRLAMEIRCSPLPYSTTNHLPPSVASPVTSPVRMDSPKLDASVTAQQTSPVVSSSMYNPPLDTAMLSTTSPVLPGSPQSYTDGSGRNGPWNAIDTYSQARCRSGIGANRAVRPIQPLAMMPNDELPASDSTKPVLGKGKDYFEEMFKDEEGRPKSARGPVSSLSSDSDRPANAKAQHYNHCTNSATGSLRIHEVDLDGKSITVVNTSENQDVEFGGYLIQQNVGGSPVAVYRFPPRLSFKANSFITVYSGTNDTILHQPPHAFVWKEQDRWGTGPECTTILCKPNGQAIAWVTALHRHNAIQFNGKQENQLQDCSEQNADEEGLNQNVGQHALLKREKEAAPILPSFNEESQNADQQPQRVTFFDVLLNESDGVDQPLPHQPLRPKTARGRSGASAARMGSASLRNRSRPSSAVPRNHGITANGGHKNIYSPFHSPLQQQFSAALNSGTSCCSS